MKDNTQTRNIAIDLCKYVASLMIIGIHTRLLTDVNETLGFITTQVICRLAVPFFALTTGYYLARALSDNKKPRIIIFKEQWYKIIKIYIVWSVLYFLFILPQYIDGGLISLIKWYTIDTILHGSHYHLWYLLALIFSLPLFYLIWNKSRKHLLLCVAILLYSTYVMQYAYQSILSLSIISPIVIINGYSPAFLSGIGIIVPYLIMGGFLSCIPKIRISSTIAGIITILLTLIVVYEALTLKSNGVQQWTYLFSSPLPAIFAFISALQTSFSHQTIRKIAPKLGRISLIVYCIHPMFCELLDSFGLNTIALFVITSILSTGFGFALEKKLIFR